MKFMRFLLIVVIFTFSCTYSTSLSIGEEFSIPFNDLLPPLLETELSNATKTTTTTTAKPTAATTTTKKPTTTTRPPTRTTVKVTTKPITTHVPPSLFKSTKKSYYQKQTEHIKELHLIDDDMLVPHDYKEQAEHLQNLQAAPENDYQQLQENSKTTVFSTNKQQQKFERIENLKPLNPTTLAPIALRLGNQQKSNSFIQKAGKPAIKNKSQQPKVQKLQLQQQVARQQVAATHANLALATQRNQENQQQKQFQEFQAFPHIQKSQNLQQQPSLSQQKPFKIQQFSSQHRFNLQQQQQQQQQQLYQSELNPLNFDALHQYIDYEHTTHRPPKAGLPTLTPFPRHLK